jgi:hypothetical protein
MIDRNSKWDRQELYEKVWQVPLRKLAAEYSMSDVGLAKVCRKLDIPLPGLGHWTKIACGHTIPRPPLPAMENVPVLIRQTREPETPVLPEDEAKLEVIERVAAATTPPVTKAMLAHPLIEKTKSALTGAAAGDRGILWGGRDVDYLDIRVSKDRLARALRIMAVTLNMLEQEGFKLVLEKKEPESTSAIVYGENIRFGVVEKSRQIKSAERSGTYTYNRVTLEPTGILSLELWNYCPERLRRAWRDSERAKLEEHLPACVAGMMKIALAARSRRDAEEKEEQARQKRIDEVRAVLTQIEKEETKIKELRREAIAWHRAERIRKYIAAVRESAAKDAEWLAWAERQADRIDPLKENPQSIVDDKPEVLRRLRSVERWW